MLLKEIRERTRRPNVIRQRLVDIDALAQLATDELDLDDLQKQMSQTLDQRLLYKLALQYVDKYRSLK